MKIQRHLRLPAKGLKNLEIEDLLLKQIGDKNSTRNNLEDVVQKGFQGDAKEESRTRGMDKKEHLSRALGGNVILIVLKFRD